MRASSGGTRGSPFLYIAIFTNLRVSKEKLTFIKHFDNIESRIYMYEFTNIKSKIRTEEAIDNIEFDKKFTCTNLRIYESKEKFTFVENVNV